MEIKLGDRRSWPLVMMATFAFLGAKYHVNSLLEPWLQDVTEGYMVKPTLIVSHWIVVRGNGRSIKPFQCTVGY